MSHNTSAIPELDSRGLRNFGLMTGAIFAVLFGVALPWLFSHSYPVWPWVLFTVMAAWALAAPSSLRIVYRGWMRLGLLLSKVTTPLILGIVYFILIVPFGLMRRVFGRDPMARKFSAEAVTYRVMSEQPKREDLENPY